VKLVVKKYLAKTPSGLKNGVKGDNERVLQKGYATAANITYYQFSSQSKRTIFMVNRKIK